MDVDASRHVANVILRPPPRGGERAHARNGSGKAESRKGIQVNTHLLSNLHHGTLRLVCRCFYLHAGWIHDLHDRLSRPHLVPSGDLDRLSMAPADRLHHHQAWYGSRDVVFRIVACMTVDMPLLDQCRDLENP